MRKSDLRLMGTVTRETTMVTSCLLPLENNLPKDGFSEIKNK